MMFGLGSEFRYLACAGCATVRIADQPRDMAPFYPSDYYSVDLDPERALGRVPVRQFAAAVGTSRVHGSDRLARLATAAITKRQFRTMMSILEAVRRSGVKRTGHVLDVGCGSGMIAFELGLAGFAQVIGVDPFAAGDRLLDNGVRIQRQDLAEVTGTFDLVMFHHSLEHVPDPEGALRQAAQLLSPGGRILVRMPTVSSTAFEEYRSDWVQFDAPRHFTIFSRSGFATCVERVGLRIEDLTDDSTSFQFWGSEQVRAGIALESPESVMVDPRRSAFSSAQLRDWDRRARELNELGLGDQAVWILQRAQ